jgi:peptidoglycan/xylan/chitin deacetylase (PgdA/CDA1 family)
MTTVPTNGTKLTIVIYHYVRDTVDTPYPGLNTRTVDEFEGQVQYINRYYNVISGQDLLAVLDGNARLPQRACLLTFDDGYTEHYETVLPILENNGLSGCFFPAVVAARDGEVLAVNKIQFVLAVTPDPSEIVSHINRAVNASRSRFHLREPEHYWDEYAKSRRFDTADVVYIKRMLQFVLPAPLRKELTDDLFSRFVTRDERSFARDLYLSEEKLQDMRKRGMYIGGHGHSHRWLNRMDVATQEQEIRSTLQFLQGIGTPTDNWLMCYPFGGHDDTLRKVLRESSCAAGFTVQQGIANLDADDPLALPRLDTNVLPVTANAPECEWTHEMCK